MRVTLSSEALSLVLISGCKAGASDYSLIGTWVTADNPIPAGCNSKVVFTEMTMYFESPAIPNLMPASKGTVNVLYGGDPKNPKQQVVQNPVTMMMDDWTFSDPKHAISGNVAQCHYVKQ